MSEMRSIPIQTPSDGGTAVRVTADEVRRVAELANLELTAEELPEIGRDLNAILGYIAQLNQLDTTGIAPMAQVGELLTASGATETSATTTSFGGDSLRADQVRPSLDRNLVLAAAPETDGAFFKVPKVIER